MTGAVDMDECPYPRNLAQCARFCGRCRVCGYGKHSAVHGPFLGQPPGSEPFNHEFVPEAAQLREWAGSLRAETTPLEALRSQLADAALEWAFWAQVKPTIDSVSSRIVAGEKLIDLATKIKAMK